VGIAKCVVMKADYLSSIDGYSLLPVGYHPSVAELCIKYHKHLVTASYISPGMRALHERLVSLPLN
jgi:hypothetical protein